jgi:flavin-dependent dehydrogenase
LKLCDAEDVSKKNKKDKKQESFVTHAAKIERWFADEKEKQPVEDWSKERVEGVIRMLTGVTNIVDILKAQL